ncbi:MAG: hypothetical protein AAGD01_10645 [Acidobacteriota bacterium]
MGHRYIREISLKPTEVEDPIDDIIATGGDLARHAKNLLVGEEQRYFLILLDDNFYSIATILLGIDINPNAIEPRHFWAPITRFDAPRFAVLTNHKEDPTPSGTELDFCTRLSAEAAVLETNLSHFVIVAGASFWSASQAKLTGFIRSIPSRPSY